MAWGDNPLLIQFRRRLFSSSRPHRSTALPIVLWGVFLWWGIRLFGVSVSKSLVEAIVFLLVCGAVATIASLAITTWHLRTLRQSRVLEELAVTPLLSREITLGVFIPIFYSQCWVWIIGLGLVGVDVVTQVDLEKSMAPAALLAAFLHMATQSAIVAAMMLHHWLRDCSEWRALWRTSLPLIVFPWISAILALVPIVTGPEYLAIVTWPFLILGVIIWQGWKPLQAIHIIDELSDIETTNRWWQRVGGVDKERDSNA